MSAWKGTPDHFRVGGGWGAGRGDGLVAVYCSGRASLVVAAESSHVAMADGAWGTK